MSGSFIIDSRDLGEAEQLLTATYTKVRLTQRSHGSNTRTRVWRTPMGELDVDDFEYSYDMQYAVDPMQSILLCRVLKGSIEDHVPGREPELFASGEAGAIGAIDCAAYDGLVHSASFTAISIDRSLLTEVAAPARGDEPVRLTSSAPISAEASQHLVDAIDHVRHTVVNSAFAQEPFLAGSVARYLAATMLTTIPNTAAGEPTVADRHDSTPALLRRAIAFIDENAHNDISPADIATAAKATPTALTQTFRKHRDCTPMDYVRRVRLEHARGELLASDPETTNVSDVARRWGFRHAGLFARRYAQTYGGEPDSRRI
ncbi:helix-turn-helix domain-containing protein [Mycolicibacterium moriokaense]|nr:helix-turn-helix domain-containing protein [Mycolicibacterium moriokaense]